MSVRHMVEEVGRRAWSSERGHARTRTHFSYKRPESTNSARCVISRIVIVVVGVVVVAVLLRRLVGWLARHWRHHVELIERERNGGRKWRRAIGRTRGWIGSGEVIAVLLGLLEARLYLELLLEQCLLLLEQCELLLQLLGGHGEYRLGCGCGWLMVLRVVRCVGGHCGCY